MNGRAIVVINETHKLTHGQMTSLIEEFGTYDFCPVSKNGWNVESQLSKLIKLRKKYESIVFVSPVPYMLATASRIFEEIWVFMSDVRKHRKYILCEVPSADDLSSGKALKDYRRSK